MRFMTTQNTKLLVNEIHIHNDIHELLECVTVETGLDKGLGLKSTSATAS